MGLWLSTDDVSSNDEWGGELDRGSPYAPSLLIETLLDMSMQESVMRERKEMGMPPL